MIPKFVRNWLSGLSWRFRRCDWTLVSERDAGRTTLIPDLPVQFKYYVQTWQRKDGRQFERKILKDFPMIERENESGRATQNSVISRWNGSKEKED